MISITSYFGDKHLSHCFPTTAVSGLEIIATVFKDVSDSVVSLCVNGKICDVHTLITEDANVEPVFAGSASGLEILRRSAANITAQAIMALYPTAKLAQTSTFDSGFSCDFDIEETISEKNFGIIEEKIEEIISKNTPFCKESWKIKEAKELFWGKGDTYKLEALSHESGKVNLYKCGTYFDIYYGPLAPSTGYVKAFKITKIAGAYLLGDNKNKMLQRVTGTAFESKKSLNDHFVLLAEAERRDHRRIAKDLEWFHVQNEALGQVFWHEKGWTLYRTIEDYLRKKLRANGYSEIKTPIMLDRKLWEESGHWDKFRDNMFIVTDQNKKELAIKPMNCPCHVQIFKSKTRSYKDLPIRMSEFGMCHRNEPSGSLYGLMRVRGFTQDDAHIFCTSDQIRSEVLSFYQLLKEVYNDFGFTDISVKLSDRPENRIGSDDLWDKAERSLMDSMNDAEVKYEINRGEGAFYGPKLEFVLKDALGRDWQCGTVQLDFVLPERLGAQYTGADGKRYHPVMIHRAILGTLERFIGILIESYSGNVPAWLAPVQLNIITINKNSLNYATSLKEMAEAVNVRVELLDGEENVSQKIRQSIFNKVPILWVVGMSEVERGWVSVRRFGYNDACGMEADKALKTLLTCVSIR
ncbi:MAG: threonine--tRNA ligase [Aaplasma endosymbiont of Hyalomma asiaticum]